MWIAIGLFERLEDFAAQAIVQRVALLRPVQRDAPDARTRLVDDDVLVAHEVLPIARLFAFERGLAGDRKRCHRLQTQISSYVKHFGSLRNACALIGYVS